MNEHEAIAEPYPCWFVVTTDGGETYFWYPGDYRDSSTWQPNVDVYETVFSEGEAIELCAKLNGEPAPVNPYANTLAIIDALREVPVLGDKENYLNMLDALALSIDNFGQ